MSSTVTVENKDIHKVDSLVAVYFLAFIQKVRGCPCCCFSESIDVNICRHYGSEFEQTDSICVAL